MVVVIVVAAVVAVVLVVAVVVKLNVYMTFHSVKDLNCLRDKTN